MRIPGSLVLYVPIIIYLLYLLTASYPELMVKLLAVLVCIWVCCNGAAICGMIFIFFNEGWEVLKKDNKKDITDHKLVSILVIPIIYIIPLTDYLNKHLTFKI